MAIVLQQMQSDLEKSIFIALSKEFAKESAADPESNKKLAAAIAKGVAIGLAKAFVSAEVAPGIPTAGSPISQVTTAPGKLL